MSNPAIDKMERRLAALDARIDDALANAHALPADWEMLVQRAGDLVDRLVEANEAYRVRMTPALRRAA